MTTTSATTATLLEQLYTQLKQTSQTAQPTTTSTPKTTTADDATPDSAKLQASFLLSLSPEAQALLQSAGLAAIPTDATTNDSNGTLQA